MTASDSFIRRTRNPDIAPPAKVERQPIERGALTWDSKRRAWVDARTGEVVGKVAA